MVLELPPRTPLATLPTPLERADRLSDHWGGPRIWMKRDDLTGFGLSGYKVRKLEFHFAAAADAGTDTVITCGAVQSNHSRATALAAARLGYRCILYLRKPAGDVSPDLAGNYLLDRLAGAQVRFITPNEYEHRNEIMMSAAAAQKAEGHPSWVIPEGASDALGMWGFVVAMRELADQVSRIESGAVTLWHAASSGGTTAGIGWAADRLGLAMPIVACSIGDAATEIEAKVQEIWREAASAVGATVPSTSIDYIDRHIGEGYGLVSDEDLEIQAEATALTGLVFDPTYTGKALAGLRRDIGEGRYAAGENVVFWHTGGGFAAFSHDFSRIAAVAGSDAPTG